MPFSCSKYHPHIHTIHGFILNITIEKSSTLQFPHGGIAPIINVVVQSVYLSLPNIKYLEKNIILFAQLCELLNFSLSFI